MSDSEESPKRPNRLESPVSCSQLYEQLSRARSEGGVFRLSTRLVVRLSGKDAFRYLNGQVTRDVKRLEAARSLPACLLTPKGKLCATVFIRRDHDDLLVEADPSLEETLLARLDRYIVADEVTLSVDPAAEIIHCFGRMAEAHEGIRVSRLGIDGVDLQDDFEGPLLDPRVIETLRIERGIPAWGCEMNEDTLPPEIGFDRTHIDYDRGCYPGQETISRLKSIGRVRRLLHTLTAPTELRVGMKLLDAHLQEIGSISSASEQFDTGSWVALAVLPRDTQPPLFVSDPCDPLTEEKRAITITQIHGS